MLFHATMLGLLGGMLWSCLMSLGYVVFLHRNLILSHVPAIQKRVADTSSFKTFTAYAHHDYLNWVLFRLPVIAISTVNVLWMWRLLATGADISTLHTIISALSIAWVFTMVFTGKIAKSWAYVWDTQISYAKDDVVLEVMAARMDEINKTVVSALQGEITLSVSELQGLLAETTAIDTASDVVAARQVHQLETLKRIASSRKPTQQ